MNKMNRRDFLKLAGVVSASGAVLSVNAGLLPGLTRFVEAQVRTARGLIRGTARGEIQFSSNDGAIWDKLVGFGEQHTVTQVLEDGGQLYANLSFGGHDFWLKSADGRQWFTV